MCIGKITQTILNFNEFSFPIFSLDLIRKVSVPSVVYTASLLLSNKIFICGGEDFKLYKYNFETGTEIGEAFKLKDISLSKVTKIFGSTDLGPDCNWPNKGPNK